MIQLILQQQYLAFVLIAFALILSLTCHEFGHGKMASLIGDDTAKRAGRLTLNPIPHIDPFGLLMVLLIGIGYAKPVPTDPRKFNTRWGMLLVAAAGPAMNLLLAIITINVYVIGLKLGIGIFQTDVANFFFTYLALINMLLMLFNLLPFGPLDGSYILLKLVHFLSTYKPFLFFGSVSAVLTLTSLALGLPVVVEFLETGLVPRFPTAILATGIMIAAVSFFAMSLTLDVLSRYHAETKWLAYLRDPVLPSPVEQGNG